VIEPGERAGLFDERREDALALGVAGLRERVGLGDLQHEKPVGAGLADLPHGADAALAEGLRSS
jgi:hypothetical protein